MSAQTLRIKRVYDAPVAEDGLRVLVDRLWPRGLSTDAARIDLWLKELAPSNRLRRAVHDGTMEWSQFVKAYEGELSEEPALSATHALLQRPEHTLTLLYASKNTERNNAVALAAWLRSASA